MPAETGIYVSGIRELSAAFALAGGQINKEFRASERAIAEPVRRDAETLSLENIRRMPLSPGWAKMRTGVTRGAVYVAPKQRGVRGRSNKRRPKLADLMMDRAMVPALERNRAGVERDVDALLGRVTQRFNEGGP